MKSRTIRLLVVPLVVALLSISSIVMGSAVPAGATVVAVRARDAAGNVDNRLTQTSPSFDPLLVTADINVDPLTGGISGFAGAYASLQDGLLRGFVAEGNPDSTATPDAIAQLRETIWLVGIPDLDASTFSFSI